MTAESITDIQAEIDHISNVLFCAAADAPHYDPFIIYGVLGSADRIFSNPSTVKIYTVQAANLLAHGVRLMRLYPLGSNPPDNLRQRDLTRIEQKYRDFVRAYDQEQKSLTR